MVWSAKAPASASMLVGLILGGRYTAGAAESGSAEPLLRALLCRSEAVVVAVGDKRASGRGAYCMGSSSAESASAPSPALSSPCACTQGQAHIYKHKDQRTLGAWLDLASLRGGEPDKHISLPSARMRQCQALP